MSVTVGSQGLPSNQVSSASPTLRDAIAWLQSAAGVAAVLVGALYAVGLLIVNVDLRRYGFVNLSLARAEYAVTGALWAFLTVVGIAALDYIVASWRASTERLLLTRYGLVVLDIMVTTVAFFLFLNYTSHGALTPK